MKKLIIILGLSFLLFNQCSNIYKMSSNFKSDKVMLDRHEENAVFLAVNHVDILKIKGMELYHYFLIVLVKNPGELKDSFDNRNEFFYDVVTRDLQEEKVSYFDKKNWKENTIWETTISASSECGYDPKAKKLGQLIKVPNYDRLDNNKSGRRVFVKKIAVNDWSVIKKILEFEYLYNDSEKYVLIPEGKRNGKGYNSNSYCRGVLEYAGLMNQLEVPRCYKSPGISKVVTVAKID